MCSRETPLLLEIAIQSLQATAGIMSCMRHTSADALHNFLGSFSLLRRTHNEAGLAAATPVHELGAAGCATLSGKASEVGLSSAAQPQRCRMHTGGSELTQQTVSVPHESKVRKPARMPVLWS